MSGNCFVKEKSRLKWHNSWTLSLYEKAKCKLITIRSQVNLIQCCTKKQFIYFHISFLNQSNNYIVVQFRQLDLIFNIFDKLPYVQLPNTLIFVKDLWLKFNWKFWFKRQKEEPWALKNWKNGYVYYLYSQIKPIEDQKQK